METLIRLFWDICRFKKGPENIPSAINLFIVILLLNFILESFLWLSVYTFTQSVLLSSFSVVCLLSFTWFWLMMFKLSHRFFQSAIAFVGVSLFTNLLFFLPFTALWSIDIISKDTFGILNLLLIAWILSIYAHIFRSALNVSFFLGFALSITYFITFNTLSINILGV